MQKSTFRWLAPPLAVLVIVVGLFFLNKEDPSSTTGALTYEQCFAACKADYFTIDGKLNTCMGCTGDRICKKSTSEDDDLCCQAFCGGDFEYECGAVEGTVQVDKFLCSRCTQNVLPLDPNTTDATTIIDACQNTCNTEDEIAGGCCNFTSWLSPEGVQCGCFKTSPYQIPGILKANMEDVQRDDLNDFNASCAQTCGAQGKVPYVFCEFQCDRNDQCQCMCGNGGTCNFNNTCDGQENAYSCPIDCVFGDLCHEEPDVCPAPTSSSSSSSTSSEGCGGTQSNPLCSGTCPSGQSCGVVATDGIDEFTCGCRTSSSPSSSSISSTVSSVVPPESSAPSSFPPPSSSSSSRSSSTPFVPCTGIVSSPLCTGICPQGQTCRVVSTIGIDSFQCGCVTNSSTSASVSPPPSSASSSTSASSFTDSSRSVTVSSSQSVVTPSSLSSSSRSSVSSFITDPPPSSNSSSSFFVLFSSRSSSSVIVAFNSSSTNTSYTYDASPYCGNGIREGNERCDDGNVANGDGCSSSCRTEETAIQYICGNGVTDSTEECDDGNNVSNDGCNTLCQVDNRGCTRNDECSTGVCLNGSCYPCATDAECQIGRCINNICTLPTLTAAAPLCGNGVLESPEECDDSNARDGDGCASTCFLEAGVCGDGKIQKMTGEQCEPSMQDSSLPYACINCRLTPFSCGNGIVESGEECDDGNTIFADGCDTSCRKKSDVASAFTNQSINFPNMPSTTTLPFQLPLAQLQPIIQAQGPVGDTGPAAVAVIATGAASGLAWIRRKRK